MLTYILLDVHETKSTLVLTESEKRSPRGRSYWSVISKYVSLSSRCSGAMFVKSVTWPGTGRSDQPKNTYGSF